VAGLGILDAGIGEAAAAIAGLGRAPGESLQIGANLGARISGMGGRSRLEPVPELAVEIAQIGGGQLVLRGEAAIEAGLVAPARVTSSTPTARMPCR
jgi:hypothetical protein